MSTSVDIKFKDFGYFDSDVTGFDDATGLPIFDRAQNSEFLANMLGALIGNGVYPNPSTNLQVIERDDAVFGVQVLPGKIWIDGRFAWPKEPILLEADPASTTADRIDIIVVERNNPDRKFTVKRITGAPAASPVPPSPERTTDVHQRVLCQYRVRKNATNINQSDILDTRMDNELCGWTTGLIDQVDTSEIFLQYTAWLTQIQEDWDYWIGVLQADSYASFTQYQMLLAGLYAQFLSEIAVYDGNVQAAYEAYVDRMQTYEVTAQTDFEAWVETLKDILDEEVAGHLQLEIEELQQRMPTVELGTVQIPAETPLYPCCTLYASEWGFGIGGAGLGPAGGGSVSTVGADITFDEYDVTVTATTQYAGFTEISKLSDTEFAFLSDSGTQSLVLQIKN